MKKSKVIQALTAQANADKAKAMMASGECESTNQSCIYAHTPQGARSLMFFLYSGLHSSPCRLGFLGPSHSILPQAVHQLHIISCTRCCCCSMCGSCRLLLRLLSNALYAL